MKSNMLACATASLLLCLAAGTVAAEKSVRVAAVPASPQGSAPLTSVRGGSQPAVPAAHEKRQRVHLAHELPAGYCLTHTC